MASLICDANGEKRVSFVDGKRKVKTIYLGKVRKTEARNIQLNVADLNSHRITQTALPPELARWVADSSDWLHAKLAKVGLVEPRAEGAAETLGGLLEKIIAHATVKPSTLLVVEQGRRSLENHFGKDRPLAKIGPVEADGWRKSLEAEGLARATISKRVLLARAFFKRAMRWRLVTENPFTDVKAGLQSNPERAFFVTDEATVALLAACPGPEWRVLLGLCRYAGLRCPSEVGGLRWSDVSWDRARLLVRSPKTAGHEGKAERAVPIVPELMPLLLEAFAKAEPGVDLVVPMSADPKVNLRKGLGAIVKRAGLAAWPRPFHNLRASFATAMVERFPSHVVAAWAGHSVAVAEEHYLQVRDAHFALASGGGEGDEKGARKPARTGAVVERKDAQAPKGENTKSPETRAFALAGANTREEPIALLGFEPRTKGL